MKWIYRLIDRVMMWKLMRALNADLCAVCAHPQIAHHLDQFSDARYCSRCRKGVALHPFEELEGRTRK